MPTERRIRIWTGMGTWLLAGTSAVALTTGVAGASPAQPGGGPHATAPQIQRMAQQGGEKGAHDHAAPDARQQGGEGGEGGEASEGGEAGVLAGADPTEVYLARLLLIRGHLDVGRELYDSDRPDDALPHYLHPLEEIYEELEPALAERKAKGFEKDLKALADAIKAKQPKPDVAKRQYKVMAAIDAAAKKIPSGTAKDPHFAADVVVLLLKSAAHEYGDAFADERIANSVEYQDSKGFVTTAADYVRGHEKAMRTRDPQAYDAIVRAIDELAAAYPSALPPEKPVLTAGAFQAVASRVELQASRFR